jgi:DNA (cytosine-5)-methyltransferase 1
VKPRLLDLCSGLGGAAMGYSRAGFDVVCVDIVEQPDCPFEFHRDDAFGFLIAHHAEFDAVHASFPCQASSAPTRGTNAKRNTARGRRYLDLNPAGRALLDEVGLPYVMENVQGSVLRRDLTLCGEQFGLRVLRHRYLELGGWSTTPLPHKPHRGRVRGWRHGAYCDGPYLAVYGNGGGKASVEECREGLGIDWSWDRAQLVEAIPPAFTEWVGGRLFEHVARMFVQPPPYTVAYRRPETRQTTGGVL